MTTINIFNISRLKTYTDGDGISTLVGCVGCPLRCAYCLNPYSWDNSVKSQTLTVEELYDMVKIDNLYFLSTGGGIVFGGGEPLLHSEFIREFVLKYKNTCWKFGLETSLSANKDSLKDLIDCIDYFIVDVKDLNRKRYELYTLGDYDKFLENLTFLRDNVESNRIHVKVPKIPNLHKENEILESLETLKDMGFERTEVFSYIEPENTKSISEAATKRKEDFLKSI